MKSHCCGGSLVISNEGLALGLMHKLLKNAGENGAECLITPCPLCQLNLDAFLGKVNRRFGTSFNLPVLYFTQLIGLALELEPNSLGLNTNIISANRVIDRINKVTEEETEQTTEEETEKVTEEVGSSGT